MSNPQRDERILPPSDRADGSGTSLELDMQRSVAEPRAGVGAWIARGVSLVVGLLLVGGMLYFGAGWLSASSAERGSAVLTHQVGKSDLLITVTEDGNVQSAGNVEIKCQVAGGSSILWIVPDGENVKQGEKLVQLDSSQLEDQINQQKITYEKARSAMVQAEKDYAVAQIAVREYLEGTLKKELQDSEALITIALENLRTAQNILGYSKRMFRKGYISSLELESQEFGVQRAQLDLDSARTAKDVLVNFTREKMLEDLRSAETTAQARMESEKASFALEEARLKRFQDQLANCVIYAPQDGMVVYANETQGRFGSQQGPQIEEGAAVRERQTIFRLPDLSRMEVKVNVHETKVEQLRPGMRARVRVLGRDLPGTVTSIANQPEPSSWFSGNVKQYATIVRINGEPEALRPGMTAEVEILVAHLKEVVSLPVAAVVQQRGQYVAWVETPEGPQPRPLLLGMSNDRFVEVQDGVQAGENVVLNPRSVIAMAPEPAGVEETGQVGDRFGNEPAGEGPASPSPADRMSPGPPGAGRPAPSDPQAPTGEGAAPGARPGGGRNLMDNDTDGDGRVSRAEAPERMQAFFDRIDTNGDGFIDAAENNAARQRMQSGGGPPGSGPPGGR